MKFRKAFLKFRVPVLAAVGVVTTAAQSFALSIVDYTSLGSSVTAELTPAISAAIPIMGTILAVGVGIKTIRHIIH